MTSPPGNAQLVFDLPHRTALGQDDFLVSPSNIQAVGWIDRWPGWPGGILALVGPAASGKSHLIEVWRAHSGAGLMNARDLEDERWLGLEAGMAIDDMAELRDETALLHAINWCREKGACLLMASELPPTAWPVTLPDLRSRLATIQVAEIKAPDDTLMDALIVKQFADRQLAVPPEVVAYIRLRIERSFAAVRAVVDRLDTAALAEKRPITLPFVRRILGGDASGMDGLVIDQ